MQRHDRGGVLLDALLALGLLALGAFALDRVGITLPDLLQGVRNFFGL